MASRLVTRRVAPAAAVAASCAVAFGVLTWLTFGTGLLTGLDATSLTPAPDPMSPSGQVLSALSFVFHPVVVYAGLACAALWAYRRRLRNLTWALAIAILLGAGSAWLLKGLARRPRPPGNVPLITGEGAAYPSGHVVAISIAIAMAVVIVAVTRRSPLVVWSVRTVGVLAWFVVAYDRWALRAHWPTDILASGLWGAMIAAVALGVSGVHLLRPFERPKAVDRPLRVSVIVNPTKVSDWMTFRGIVEGEVRAQAGAGPVWLETLADDPGVAATREARRRRSELVLVAGGDGTVRTVCAGLAGSGIPLAILPAGTGNLLARNLGIPLDLDAALDVAFDGTPHPMDLVRLRADHDGEDHYSAVMAGMGADAAIMAGTNPDLKRVVGSGAYVVAAVSAAARPPFSVGLTVDHGTRRERDVGMVLVANVGQLMGGITIAPDAHDDDGLLDVLTVSTTRPADWVEVAGRMVGGLADSAGVHRAQGRRVVVEASEPVPWQIDGDGIGECRRLEAVIVPGCLAVMVP